MKKGNIVKFSAATMVALSAITPVAAFASETKAETAPTPGFYTSNTLVTMTDFAAMTKSEKRDFLLQNIKSGALVLVQNGLVFDMTDPEIQKAQADQVEKLGKTEEQYTADTGNTLTPEGIQNSETDATLTVTSVSAITSTYVEVTFEALADKVEGATVEVKDNKGNVVEVVAQDLAKGAKSAQFDFKAEYKADQEGVWTVNGAEFNFDIKAQLEAISKAASEGNEVKLLAALEAAGLENINEELISDYLAAIDGEELTSVADVQAILDEVNEDTVSADEKEAAVKAVVAATTQPQLLTALQAKFERVNADWIKDYADVELVAEVTTPGSEADAITLLNVTDKNTPVGLTFTALQGHIDAANADAITTADTAADTSAKQAAVTALIQKWVEADEGTATAKADQVALSQLHTAAFKVAEATTNSAIINTLTAYANISTTTLKATDVLDVNKAAYLAAVKGDAGAVTGFKAADIKSAITGNKITKAEDIALFATKVGAVNTAEEVKSLGALVTAATTYKTTDNATNKAAFEKALKDLAAKTANLAAADKINLNAVDSAKLLEYAKAIDTAAGTPTDVDTTKEIAGIISDTNAGETVSTAVETVNKATSTATQVRDALTELVISTGVVNGNDYLSLSSAAKLEVAELVIAARPDGGFTESAPSAADEDEVIAAAAVAQAGVLVGFLDDFNTIKVSVAGAEVAYVYSDVADILESVEGTDYEVLTGAAKVAATEKFFNSITVTSKELADGSFKYAQQKFASLAEIKAAINAATK